ncbi:unnamed protein product [Protopolystoma xenopodis]|uniref:Calcium release-activated calcium channel protein 1 n=1 Tax=Protopolystoma xenopodis TaxID=117903 RepID=A0A3S5CN70_9PLAT|nr:unnamed protein product [Protopolystoma xenopodis]
MAQGSTNYIRGKHYLAWRSIQLSRAKLKASSRTSALLSGFAMVAIIELNIEESDDHPVPEGLIIVFTALACLLVVVHIMALMISTCILPHLESHTNMYDHKAASESPHERMRTYIEMAWIFSTGLGILLFLVVVVMACWVKFWTISKWSAGVATLIIGPVLLVFIIFAALFYRSLVSHKFEHATEMMNKLDLFMSQLENGTSMPYYNTDSELHDSLHLHQNDSTSSGFKPEDNGKKVSEKA